MRKGKGYRFKKADANSYVFGKLATLKKASPAEAGVQPKQDVLAAMMAGMTGNASGDNCGTGAGGFKKGNTCASGREVASNIDDLASKLRMANIEPSKTRVYAASSVDVDGDQEARALLARSTKILRAMGFYPAEGFGYNQTKDSIRYEHPHGHTFTQISYPTMWTAASGPREVDSRLVFVPKENREGLVLSKEAHQATQKAVEAFTSPPLGGVIGQTALNTASIAVQQLLQEEQYKGARASHKEAIHLLNRLGTSKGLSTHVKKLIDDAVAAHGIANDWYMEKMGVQNSADNCGTGAGGFKKGNTCAKGSNLDETDWRSMVTSLGIDPARFNRLIGGNYTNSKNTVGIHSAGDPAHDGNLSPSELSDRLHKSYNSIIEKLTNAGFKRDPKGNNIWEYYYHPSGHEIEFHLERVREGQLYDSRYQDNSSRLVQYTGVLHFVPKENREGVAISREALEASWKATGFRDAKEAKEAAVRGDLAMARRRHEFAEAYHRQQAQYHAHNPYTVKMENEAADLHAIARDWYMQKLGVQNRSVWNNCGTGAGGFKKGNTCASGDGEVADSFSDLKDKLGLGNGKFYKFHSTETAGYTTQDHTSHAVAKMEHDRVTRLVTKMGFKAISKTEGRLNGGIATRYEHPHGHRLDVGLSSDDKAYTWVQIEFVPKKFREALSLAEAAQAASVLATPDSEIPAVQAVTYTRHGQSQEAINQHKFMMDYHGRGLQYVKDPEVRKQHERAVTAHSIARDWHMDNLGVTNGKWKPVQRS